MQDAATPLKEYLATLRLRKWSILGVTALTLLVALFFSFRKTPMYTSTAKVLVKPLNSAQQIQPGGYPPWALVDMETEKGLATSTSVARMAAGKLGTTPGVILSDLSANVPSQSRLLSITYTDPDPVTAEKGAQAVAEAYLRFRTTQAAETFAGVQGALESQITRLQAELQKARQHHDQARVTLITGQIGYLQNQAGITVPNIDPGQIVAPAALPQAPSSPNHPLDAGVGLILGLVLGVGAGFLRERLDDRLRGRAQLEDHLGAPTLAVIPKVAGWKHKEMTRLMSAEAPRSPASEAYRTLRTSILFLAAQRGLKVLMVTSPSAGEGKTTTSANLAVVLAQGGKQVILVSADLRKPRIHRFLGVSNDYGLSDVLTGQGEVEDALQESPVEGLRFLGTGSVAGVPEELLQAGETEKVFAALAGLADFVIVDCAPALAVADPLILAPIVDGILFVGDPEHTTQGAVTHARDQLEQIGGRIVGGVLNNFDPSKARGAYHYGYYYRYRYREGYGDPADGHGGRVGEPVRDRDRI